MKTETNGKQQAAKNGKANDNSASRGMPESQLQELFINELKDIFWAEKALTKAIPKMIKNATAQELVQALENHLKETEEQVGRVEQVFELIGEKAVARKCKAMDGLVKEAEEIMADCYSDVVISVEDHGIGIPTDDLKNLFTSFSRGSNVGAIEGTGLGLSIAKKAVDLLHGTIDVTSTENVGTRFTVTLPLTRLTG